MSDIFIKPTRKIDRVFIHCSASDSGALNSAAAIDKMHREERGWNEIGYHYFIRKNGNLEDGRATFKIPAAQKGNNRGTIAICVHGLAVEKFTIEQFWTLRNLCNTIDRVYAGKVTFHGHCEVANKTCPVFDYAKILDLDTDGHITESLDMAIEEVLDKHSNPIGKFIMKIVNLILDKLRNK